MTCERGRPAGALARALFGRPGPPAYEGAGDARRPVRPLGDMLRVLVRIPPQAWCGYAFSREPLNGKFTDAQREAWMRQAIACGEDYARRIAASYGTSDAALLGERMGLRVTWPDLPDQGDRVLFAEYREPDSIRIYMDAIRRARRLLRARGMEAWRREERSLPNVILGHELFHYVEAQHQEEIFTRTEKVRLWSIGPFHNDSGILVLSEIAAMAFSRELNGLTCFPYVMDVLLMYGYSPEAATALFEEMIRYLEKDPESNAERIL